MGVPAPHPNKHELECIYICGSHGIGIDENVLSAIIWLVKIVADENVLSVIIGLVKIVGIPKGILRHRTWRRHP